MVFGTFSEILRVQEALALKNWRTQGLSCPPTIAILFHRCRRNTEKILDALENTVSKNYKGQVDKRMFTSFGTDIRLDPQSATEKRMLSSYNLWLQSPKHGAI